MSSYKKPLKCESYHKINMRHAEAQIVNVGGLGYNCDITERKEKMINTDNWASYPFEVNGVQFLSLLDKEGSFYPQIERLPAGVFTAQNCQMVMELIGDPSLMTRSELENELEKVNDGASQALLALA